MKILFQLTGEASRALQDALVYFQHKKVRCLPVKNLFFFQSLKVLSFEFLQTAGVMRGLSEIPTYIEMSPEEFEKCAYSSHFDRYTCDGRNLSNIAFFSGEPSLGTLKKLFIT